MFAKATFFRASGFTICQHVRFSLRAKSVTGANREARKNVAFANIFGDHFTRVIVRSYVHSALVVAQRTQLTKLSVKHYLIIKDRQ